MPLADVDFVGKFEKNIRLVYFLKSINIVPFINSFLWEIKVVGQYTTVN